MTDFRDLVDLASEKLGGCVLWASDDFFADKDNLIKPHPAEWREHEYTDRGKWMDGWESRRKRAIGPDVRDEAIIRLGLPGVVRGVVVDTSFFRGNFPDAFELEACCARPEATVEQLRSDATEWVKLEPRTPLEGHSLNFFDVHGDFVATHVRIFIYPDGGVARLRVHGTVAPDWRRLGGARSELDLAALEVGGDVLSCSDMFFGPRHNLIAPGRAINMSDGWETKRRRGPGHDWMILKLGAPGVLRKIEVDTNHFKGNFPDSCMIEGVHKTGAVSADQLADEFTPWVPVLPQTKLSASKRHLFQKQIAAHGPITHVRLNIYPDGGVSRLRLWGVRA